MSDRAPLLLLYLRETRAQGAKMRPGRFDCALYAAEWVKRCSGRDLASEWRGTYRRLQDGRAKLRAAGFAGPADLAAKYLVEIDGWQNARPGDIAAIEEDGETAFGIIGGKQIHVLSAIGLDVTRLDRAERVFRP
ncbi:hypothetical protein [Phaeobacter sp. 11ANDIMAR09]|uniref:DUF6950 family protein n=1 Tax=Phaeobacter sp. 11ANDIMAR09 TaxID=1225647 RepID=UPI0006C883D6|nr:hypothetical protein [Phaeobacter sp. 11ANDIMAR09]